MQNAHILANKNKNFAIQYKSYNIAMFSEFIPINKSGGMTLEGAGLFHLVIYYFLPATLSINYFIFSYDK